MDFEEEDVRKARKCYMSGNYTKDIEFYKLAIDKLRRYCETLSDGIEKKQATECIAELERELQSTPDHEQMIGEIQESLLASYTNSSGGQAASNDAYRGLNNKDDFSKSVVEHSTRDPDLFNRTSARAAVSFQQSAAHFSEPHRNVRLGNNNARAKKVPNNNKHVNNREKKYQPTAAEKDLVEVLERDILDKNPNVRWEDVAGCTVAKKILQEAVVLPFFIPAFFTGVRRPQKNIFLFGPPGTGKTMLVKAVATEYKPTFFNVSASSLTSKYYGEGEKFVRLLFELAKFHAPSMIFLDDIDSLCSTRDQSNEHEASRSVKSELLIQMNGINRADEGDDASKIVIVLGATNRPWNLDDEIRRLFERRIYFPLPDHETREKLLAINLKDIPLNDDVKSNLNFIAEKLERYSGSDITSVCRDAVMMPLRCGIENLSITQIQERAQALKEACQLPITMENFNIAISKISSSISKEMLEKDEKWIKDFVFD